MKVITVSMLRGACRKQRALFMKTFPDGAPVTTAAARKARKAGLQVGWLGQLVPPMLYAEYRAKCNLLYEEYNVKKDLLYDECLAKCNPLHGKHWMKYSPLYDEYRKKQDLLYCVCQAKRDAVLVTYLRKTEENKN